MKIVVIGCGGVGGVIAASLTRAGQDVTPVTGNAAIATALASQGFRVIDLDGTAWSAPPVNTPLVAIGDGDRPGPARFDLCIVATQSTSLVPALRAAAPHLAENAIVVCCQNGLPEERAAEVVGAERVLGCVVGWGASMVEPGLYKRTSRGGMQIGRPHPGAPDPASLARLLEAASETKVADDFAGVRWSKLAINCAISTMGAVGGDRLGRLMRLRFVRRLVLEVFAEVSAVARRAGVRPAPVGGTLDIARLAITADERRQRIGSPSLAYKHSVLIAVGLKYRRMRSSMLYAIERGRPPEVDFLNGELVRRGAALGVPTPVNSALVKMIGAIVDGSVRPSVETLRSLYDGLIDRPAEERTP